MADFTQARSEDVLANLTPPAVIVAIYTGASSDTQSPPLTNSMEEYFIFRPFQKLPLELPHMIFVQALPEPRQVCLCHEPDEPARPTIPLPALLHTNKESRNVCLRGIHYLQPLC